VDAQLQLRIQRYGWDKAAGEYERYWSQALEPAQNRLLQMASLRRGERVLDVACGTGLVSLRAASTVGETGSVLATDLSDEMVKDVANAAKEQSLSQVTAARMDAQAMTVKDGAYDVALCAFGLMYVPDPSLALKEMKRALRPGGRLAVAVWGAREKCGWAEIFPIVERRVESEVCPLFFQLGTADALSLTLELAGFTNIVAERMSTRLHYDSASDACAAAFVAGPVALAYSHFDDTTKSSAKAEYLQSIAAFKSGDSYDVPGEFVIATATA
jgi:ubiquinone/menaquinone biosynthesis C-methylase UbiE